MPSPSKLGRRVRSLVRDARGVRAVTKAVLSTRHPLLAHIHPMRRCNLACNLLQRIYDDVSQPVPLGRLFRRIDKLGELGTSVITISGRRAAVAPGTRRRDRTNS